MTDISNLIKYYRACFQADNRQISLSNTSGAKVENHCHFENADLLTGQAPIQPLEPKWAEKVLHTLQLYGREKELYYFAFYLVGNIAEQSICAPLLLYKAKITTIDELYYLEIDFSSRTINQFLLNIIKGQETNTSEEELQKWPQGALQFEESGQIRRIFESSAPDIDGSDLLIYPQVNSPNFINKQKKKNHLKLLSAVGAGIYNKSRTTLGILSELKILSNTQDYSRPMKLLFQPDEDRNHLMINEKVWSPAILSNSQHAILKSLKKYDLNIMIGPPGTGKSYTIAAIASFYISIGRSVLIASNNNQAVDVVGNKLASDFGLPDVALRCGKQDYKKELNQRLENLYYGMGVPQVEYQDISSQEQKITEQLKEIKKLEKRFNGYEKRELIFGGQLSKKHFIAGKFWLWVIRINLYFRKHLWEISTALDKLIKVHHEDIRNYVQLRFHFFLSGFIKNHRKDLRHFSKALKARTFSRKESFFEQINFKVVQKAFPVWLVNLADLSDTLPLEKELFDLVIIDEATQCDIASVLPLIQRAKKLLISGDPKQLRHVSFLSRDQMDLLSQQSNLSDCDPELLNFREKSILDLAADSINKTSQVHFLDEHYRSFPDIINFSNREFYNGNLKIMTSDPAIQDHQHLFIIKCEGVRNEKGYNEEEAEQIFLRIKDLIQNEQDLSKESCQTIGILSPFREQVNYLLMKAEKEIPVDMTIKHQLLIGSAYSFQGEERDVMFISLALDSTSHPTAFRHLNRSDVFNVSITRARSLQYIFTSLDPNTLNPEYLLTRYLHSIGNDNTHLGMKDPYKDEFLSEVESFLRELSYSHLHKSYPIAGIEIDLLLTQNKKSFGIDLIGYPGKMAGAFPYERYKMLSRVGIKVFPLSYSQWKLQKMVCQEALKKFIEHVE